MLLWTVHLEGGPRRVNHAAVAYRDIIYSFGGYCTGEDYNTVKPVDVHVLNTVTYQWRALPLPTEPDTRNEGLEPPWPFMRYGLSAVEWSDKAYIWGGRNDKLGASDKMHTFDLNTYRWAYIHVPGYIPGSRDGHAVCVINDKMFMFGGFEEGGPAPRWRDFHSANCVGDMLYIFGGRGDQGGPIHTSHEIYENKLFCFNTEREEWVNVETTGDTPGGRRSHSAFIHQGELYIFGGYNAIQRRHFDSMFKFNPVSCVWHELKPRGKGPSPRRRQACCKIGSRVFLFGGTSPNPEETSTPFLADWFNTEDLLDLSDLYVLDLVWKLKQ